MRTLENETVLTFKEVSQRYNVPVTWLRKQLGKPVLPGGKALRMVKFPADKNYYLFESEVQAIAMPRVFSSEYVAKTQEAYDKDPDNTEGVDDW
jgi:hypothetical protein